MFKFFFTLIISFFSLFVYAQKENLSSFNVISLSYKINPKYFFFVEGQLRAIEDFSYPDYYEIKGGLGYAITKNHKPLIGLGRYVNYKNKILNREELRFWLQDVIDVKMGEFKFENRLRAEKSWFYEPQKDLNSERIRLRYRLNVSVPLNSESVQPGTISANAFNEVFFVVTEDPLFTRNRFYSGFTYQIDDNFAISTGYIWQRDFGTTSIENTHSLFFSLNISIHKGEKEIFNYPGTD